MGEDRDDSRRYTDREMAVILKLAAELEKTARFGEGHTLGEIQQIASEAGIDPNLIVQAAANLDARSGARRTALLGAPTTYQFQQQLDGELPESELSELVRTIRRIMRREGEVSRVLDSLEWRFAEAEGASAHVEVTPRRGTTRIQVTGRYGNYAGWLYLAAALVAAVGSVVAGHELAALPVEIGVIAGLWGSAYLGARTVWRRIAAASERRLTALRDELTAQVRGRLSEIAREPEAPASRSLPGS